jgi:hypothetical protein
LKARAFFPGKASLSLFMLLGYHNCLEIGRAAVSFVTILTENFGRLFSFAYSKTTGNSFLLFTARTGAGPFTRQISPKFSKRMKTAMVSS